jgi:aspartate kinase
LSPPRAPPPRALLRVSRTYVAYVCRVRMSRYWIVGVVMQRNVSVLKFGGTSVGSGERISRVASIIKQHLQDTPAIFPVIVVSAMSGVTDQLLRIARYACSQSKDDYAQELVALRQRHLTTATEVVSDPEECTLLQHRLATAIDALSLDVEALRLTAEQTQDVALKTAAVAAWGERLSVLLVAAATSALGVAAEPVRQEIIITTHPRTDPSQPFGVVVGAEPLNEETRANAQSLVLPLVERGIVPIAAGFMGRTITGFVTTLGRNGSDYSATVIGAALDCVEVSIYTDVDGVLTADPRQVPNARLLTNLSYAEAARLSWFGAL